MVKLVEVTKPASPPVTIELTRAEFAAVVRLLDGTDYLYCADNRVDAEFAVGIFEALADAYEAAYGEHYSGPTTLTAESF